MHNRAVCRWVEWELSSVQFLLLPFWLKRNSARNFERVVIMESTPVEMQSCATVRSVFSWAQLKGDLSREVALAKPATPAQKAKTVRWTWTWSAVRADGFEMVHTSCGHGHGHALQCGDGFEASAPVVEIHSHGAVDKTRTTSSHRGAHPAGRKGLMRSVTSGARHAGIPPVGVALAVPTPAASFSDPRGVSAGVCGYRSALLHRASASRDRSANACGRVLACVDLYGIFQDLVEALFALQTSKKHEERLPTLGRELGSGVAAPAVNNRPAHVVVCVEPAPAGKHTAMSRQR